MLVPAVLGRLFWPRGFGPARKKILGAAVGGGAGEKRGTEGAKLPPFSVRDAVFLGVLGTGGYSFWGMFPKFWGGGIQKNSASTFLH